MPIRPFMMTEMEARTIATGLAHAANSWGLFRLTRREGNVSSGVSGWVVEYDGDRSEKFDPVIVVADNGVGGVFAYGTPVLVALKELSGG